jgi:hypothetical protein
LAAVAFEWSGEERGDTGLGHLDPDQPGAQRNGVRIIVAAGKAGGNGLANLGTAAGQVAVGGNGNADPRAANCNAMGRFPVGDGGG